VEQKQCCEGEIDKEFGRVGEFLHFEVEEQLSFLDLKLQLCSEVF
jgi:hypothetical protein